MCSGAEDDVVDGDEGELDDISDETHHDEADSACLQNAEVLCKTISNSH